MPVIPFLIKLSKPKAGALAVGWSVFIVVLLMLPGNDVPSIGIPGSDKIIHASLFFVLTIFYWAALRRETGAVSKSGQRLFLPFLIATLFGAATELLQKMAVTRTADFFDALADSIGAALCVVYILWSLKRNK